MLLVRLDTKEAPTIFGHCQLGRLFVRCRCFVGLNHCQLLLWSFFISPPFNQTPLGSEPIWLYGSLRSISPTSGSFLNPKWEGALVWPQPVPFLALLAETLSFSKLSPRGCWNQVLPFWEALILVSITVSRWSFQTPGVFCFLFCWVMSRKKRSHGFTMGEPLLEFGPLCKTRTSHQD